MSEKPTVRPEEAIAALFEGLSTMERMKLLSRLEVGGASIYRNWAASERNVKAREALLAAADREDANAQILRVMTQFKDACEKCHTALPAQTNAMCCSFQCTFCPDCATGLNHVCPNCGGELSARATV